MKLTVRDVLTDSLLILLTGYYVYMMIDEVTDGRFSRELSVKITKTRANIMRGIELDRTTRKNTGRVLWDAINIIDDGDENREGT